MLVLFKNKVKHRYQPQLNVQQQKKKIKMKNNNNNFTLLRTVKKSCKNVYSCAITFFFKN